MIAPKSQTHSSSLESPGVLSSETYGLAGPEIVGDISWHSNGLVGLETAVLESAGSLALSTALGSVSPSPITAKAAGEKVEAQVEDLLGGTQ